MQKLRKADTKVKKNVRKKLRKVNEKVKKIDESKHNIKY
jgi:uncharacterized protein (UPF0147 family)